MKQRAFLCLLVALLLLMQCAIAETAELYFPCNITADITADEAVELVTAELGVEMVLEDDSPGARKRVAQKNRKPFKDDLHDLLGFSRCRFSVYFIGKDTLDYVNVRNTGGFPLDDTLFAEYNSVKDALTQAYGEPTETRLYSMNYSKNQQNYFTVAQVDGETDIQKVIEFLSGSGDADEHRTAKLETIWNNVSLTISKASDQDGAYVDVRFYPQPVELVPLEPYE